MAETDSSFHSWVRKFFEIKNQIVRDETTGLESLVVSDVCNLHVNEDGSGEICGKTYKHSLRNGATTLQRHVIDKHRFSQQVQAILATENVVLPKVSNRMSISLENRCLLYFFYIQ